MAVTPVTRLMTAEQFMDADLGDGRRELVRGEIVELSPPMSDHAFVRAGIAFLRREPDTIGAPGVLNDGDAVEDQPELPGFR